MKSSMTIRRSGQFEVATVPDTPHCGTSDILEIRYEVTCKCTSDSIDTRGFLFDQVQLDQYFQGIVAVSISCEQLTMECTKGLLKLIKAENPQCHVLHIAVSLSPAPYAASITLEIGE